jgi:predicted metal-dependent HD superfamily phosphohydrolase
VSAVYDLRLCLFLGISLLATASIVHKAVHKNVREEFGWTVPLFLIAISAVSLAAFMIFPRIYSPERLAFLISVVLVVAAGRAVAVGRRARPIAKDSSRESQ